MIGWRRFAEDAREENGFSLIEAMIAIGIFFVAMLALISTAVLAFTDISLARQRQGANGLANQVMEQVRGLAIPTQLNQGLDSTSPAFLSDTNILACGSPVVYRLRNCATGEQIVHTAGSAAGVPLVPHRTPFTVADAPTAYTRSVYVTRAANSLVDTPSGAFRVTVIVSWSNPARKGVSSSIEAQTLVHQPVGCVDPALTPFAAPCSPYFYGSGNVVQGRVDVSGTIDGTSFTTGMATTAGRADVQIEQVARVQGAAVPGTVSATGGGTPFSSGGTTANSLADDDPATATPVYSSSSLGSAQAGSSTISSPSGRRIRVGTTVASGVGDTGSTTSALNAGGSWLGGTQVCPLAPAIGQPASQTDGLPCGYSRFQQQTRQEMFLDFTAPLFGLNVASAKIVGIEPAASPTWVFADRVSAAGADGNLALSASRSHGPVEIGGLPGLTFSGLGAWAGYLIRLNPYTATASAASGTGTAAPAAVPSAGAATVSVWNGVGYSTIAVGGTPVELQPCAGAQLTNCYAPVDVTAPAIGGSIRVSVTPVRITVGGTSVGQTPTGAGAGATRTESRATVNSPLIAELNYRVEAISLDGQVSAAANMSVNVDLGQLELRSGYRPAP